MSRLFRQDRPAEASPPTEPPAEARHYHYEPGLGNPRDPYTPVDPRRTPGHQPEMPARFVVMVEGEAIINTMWGRRIERWRAAPGTPCVILGSWADGTLRLKWPAIRGAYTVDGRFPAWVVAEDPDAVMAGGGRLLAAHEPPPRPPAIPFGAIALAIVLVLLLIVAFLLVTSGPR